MSGGWVVVSPWHPLLNPPPLLQAMKPCVMGEESQDRPLSCRVDSWFPRYTNAHTHSCPIQPPRCTLRSGKRGPIPTRQTSRANGDREGGGEEQIPPRSVVRREPADAELFPRSRSAVRRATWPNQARSPFPLGLSRPGCDAGFIFRFPLPFLAVFSPSCFFSPSFPTCGSCSSAKGNTRREWPPPVPPPLAALGEAFLTWK